MTKAQIIDKYIQRIMVDYPEADKIHIDLVQFAEELRQCDVSGALPLKVCTGCGWRNDKPFGSKMALACCPDNHYVELDDYLKHSVYKRQ